ncbi:MAG TPA: GNAT family N-acetyltransferase [Usitatibacter sp.]|nr:GNAT family N-acetyltransferase [Usitatibacter sp.]
MQEYQRGLGVSLCFQDFASELAGLPGEYAPPRGLLTLALSAGEAAGCVALRPLGKVDAELKRLYVRPPFRGTGLGLTLARHAIEAARERGYRTLRLDTLPQLTAALGLYRRLGFVETAPYNDNPIEGVRFMALDLAGAALNP